MIPTKPKEFSPTSSAAPQKIRPSINASSNSKKPTNKAGEAKRMTVSPRRLSGNTLDFDSGLPHHSPATRQPGHHHSHALKTPPRPAGLFNGPPPFRR